MQPALKIIGTFLFLASLCLLPAGCAAPGGQPKTHTLDEKNNGGSLEMAAGDQLEIRLVGNPTTGYEWMLKAVDESVLKPLGEPEYQSESNLIGGGGRYTFQLTALAAGDTQLELVYRRSFEPETEKPADQFSLTVKVTQ
jgi:inhibitor of cysteine peptidase